MARVRPDIHEPTFTVISLGGHDLVGGGRSDARLESGDGTYWTNPTLSLSFGEMGAVAHILWPELKKQHVGSAEMSVLNHAVPSRRRDRDVTYPGLVAAATGSSWTVDQLIESGALVPSSVAVRLLDALDLWVKHGWYLPFLAHASVMSAIHNESGLVARTGSDVVTLSGYPRTTLVQSMIQRRTTRAFSQGAVSGPAYRSILGAVASSLDGDRLRLFTGVQNVTGMDSGIYEFHDNDQDLLTLSLSRDDVRAMTIGQKVGYECAFCIWIVGTSASRADYEQDLVDLGRAGQHAVLAATASGYGAFTTPAIRDPLLYERLPIADPERSFAYFIAVGEPR